MAVWEGVVVLIVRAGGEIGGDISGGESGGGISGGSSFSSGERLSENGLEPVLSWLSCDGAGDRG